MRTIGALAVLMAAGFLAGGAAAEPTGDAERGAEVYRRCAGCHSLDSSRVGPAHRTVFGRTAGTLDGFAYSQALKDSGLVWNAETLDAWLANPGKFVPGSRMGYRLSNPQDRADVIEYLRTAGKSSQ